MSSCSSSSPVLPALWSLWLTVCSPCIKIISSEVIPYPLAFFSAAVPSREWRSCNFSRAEIQVFDRQAWCLGLLRVATGCQLCKTYPAEQRNLGTKIVLFSSLTAASSSFPVCSAFPSLSSKQMAARLWLPCLDWEQLLPEQTDFSLAVALTAAPAFCCQLCFVIWR